MELDSITALIETVRIGSINKAAEQLGYTQSGLTYIVNSVEDTLGIKIIQRGHSGITLTDEGQQLMPALMALSSSYDKLLDYTQFIRRSSESQRIRIGVYASLSFEWLPDLISGYHRIHPNVVFDIKASVLELNEMLKEQTVDLVFCEENILTDADWTFITDDPMYAVISRDLPLADEEEITLEKLSDYLVIMPTLLPNNAVSIQLRKKNIHYPNQLNLSTEDGSLTLKMTARSHGVSFVSSLFRTECPDSCVMKPFTPPIIRKIGMAVNRSCPPGAAVDDFMKYILKSSC
jgi:DNA-binding transcriptional LysR family regulator